MKMFLRRFYYWARYMRDLYVGEPRGIIERLRKQGRIKIGTHTDAYSLPTIRHFIMDDTKIEIGDYCSLSPEAYVYLGGRHKLDAVTTYPHRILWNMEGAGKDGFPTPTGDTFIGSDVWLCPGSQVMSGVRIGHGAIIGVGSVVTKDVPDFAVVAGNPARVIKYRFSEEQCKALLHISWWDWPEDEVRLAVPYLADSDIDGFIAYARERFPETNGAGPA